MKSYAELRDALEEDHQFISWIEEDNPNLKQVVGLGISIVPMIRTDLMLSRCNFWLWIYVLRKIFNDGPEIPLEFHGRLEPLRRIWLEWLDKKLGGSENTNNTVAVEQPVFCDRMNP